MNCELFHDRLPDLLNGGLATDDAATMLEHSARCAECEAVLELEELLQLERTEGAEENVPGEWVRRMWPAVRAEMGEPGAAALGRSARPKRFPRPWARVAAAVLLVGVGYLLGQWRVSSEPSEVVVPRVSVSAGPSPDAALGAATFLAALQRLPDERTLVSAEEARSLLQESFPLRRWLATLRAPIDLEDGVQAGEIRSVLDALPREGGTTLPASLDAVEIRKWLRGRV